MSATDTYSEAQVRALFHDSPFIDTVGIRVDAIADGEVRTSLQLQRRHHQQSGFAHAGVLATLADHSAGAAAATLVPTGCNVLTAEFKLNLLRPALGEILVCVARVLKPGRSLSVAESEIWCGEPPKLCAKATVTLAIGAPSGRAQA